MQNAAKKSTTSANALVCARHAVGQYARGLCTVAATTAYGSFGNYRKIIEMSKMHSWPVLLLYACCCGKQRQIVGTTTAETLMVAALPMVNGGGAAKRTFKLKLGM